MSTAPRPRPRALGLVVGLLLISGVACGSGADDSSSSDPGRTTLTTEADGGDTTTVADPPPTTGISQPTAFTTTAEDAVNELKAAWEVGDRPRAELIAPGDVIDALFAIPPESFEVYGCDTGEFPTSNCNYRNRSTDMYIKVTAARSDAGWQISTVNVA